MQNNDLQALNEKLDMLMSYLYPAQKNTYTLYTWLDYWAEIYKKPNVTKRWYRDKLYHIRIIKNNLSDIPLSNLTLDYINFFISKLANSNTKEKLIITLREALKDAYKNHFLREDISLQIIKYKHQCNEGQALTIEQRKKLFQEAHKIRHGEIILFYLYTGCRRHGALNLKWSDVDFDRGVLHIPETKTKGSNRYIKMISQVEELLRVLPHTSEYVFDISQKTLQRLTNTLSRRCKFTVRIKDLRTTYGTFCGELKVSDLFTQKTMGHSNIQTTKKYYQKVLTDFQISEAGKLEQGFNDLLQNTKE